MGNWTRDKLHRFMADKFRGIKLIAVSNREPYIHVRENGKLRCHTPASGLATAIDPMLQASGGVWVAHGSGNADREVVDAQNHIWVPPLAPSYTLRRVWLPDRFEASCVLRGLGGARKRERRPGGC